jgi:hypothetical protein
MKQFLFVALSVSTALVFSYCSSSKKASAKVIPPVTYEANIQELVTANCSPCHIPAKGGNKLALDNADAVTKNIDAVINRIELNPGERGFMPFKRAKLSDSTIAVFKQWKKDGLKAK